MKLVSRIKDDKFNFQILPKIISKYIYDETDKMSKEHISDGMRDYIKKYYNLDLKTVIKKVFPSCIRVTKYQDIYTIAIDDNYTIGGYKLSNIINLIDCGNLSIKGLNLVRNAFSYTKGNLGFIYRICLKGGLKYVN